MSADEFPSFYLIADNEAATTVVNDPANALYRNDYQDTNALLISFYTNRDTVSLGRAGCDITIRDTRNASISRMHCYFRYSPTTGAVVLQDKSTAQTTVVFDDDASLTIPMSQSLHSVVVTRGFNKKIALGNRRFYRFRLQWDSDPLRGFLTRFGGPHFPGQVGPQRTTYDPAKVVYITGDMLGTGASGTVFRAVHIHSGEALAVKRFHALEGRRHVQAIREINNMLRLTNNNGGRRHPNILPIIGHDYDSVEYKWLEIYMPLKEGSVKSLILSTARICSDAQIATDVLYQMLDALHYMETHGLVHRDIKADNILYEVRQNTGGAYYHFFLADFGLSNESARARTNVGTEMFMAPEMSQPFRASAQTIKTDIWSLFATVVWIYNTDNFRSLSMNNQADAHEFLRRVAMRPEFAHIRDMASAEPRDRPSAAELSRRIRNRPGPTPTEPDLAVGIQTFDNWGSMNPITEEQQARFAANNTFQSRGVAFGPMDGTSGLAEFGTGLGSSSSQQASSYTNGIVGRDYATYTDMEGSAQAGRAYEMWLCHTCNVTNSLTQQCVTCGHFRCSLCQFV